MGGIKTKIDAISETNSFEMGLLAEVHAVQQRLSMLGEDGPLMALPEAAKTLAGHLEADLVAIYGFAEDDPSHGVLLAAHGDGAPHLERCACWPPQASGEAAEGAGGPCGFVVQDAADGDEAGRIGGVCELHQRAGLRSFAQVLMGPPSAPLGALLVARRAPAAFGAEWSRFWLRSVSTALLRQMRHSDVTGLCALMAAVHTTHDPLAAIALLLQGLRRSVFRATNLRVSVRLALARSSDADALLAELPRGGAVGVSACRLGLENTLLASVLAGRQARFVRDCGAYMQRCPTVARDIFTRASDLVASVVVLPLIGPDGEALGGLYFAADTPCTFENVKGALLGLLHTTALSLATKWGALTEAMTAEAARHRRMSASNSGALYPTAPCSASDSLAYGPESSSSGWASSSASLARRVNTDAMVQVLQQTVRRGCNRTQEADFVRELAVEGRIGRGGFGQVHLGRWHQAPAAVKIIECSKDERQGMQDAVEMAVLTVVHHPNIVQLFACLTEMVEAGEPRPASDSSSADWHAPAKRYRRLRPDEDAGEGVATSNILVMEYCDRGTLRGAVRAGAFHRGLPDGSIGVDMRGIVGALLDVAHALHYLHSMQIVHGDVKSDNVLLKSDSSRLGGFTPKLADFGLAKILSDCAGAVNLDGAGTLTHLAPEMFVAGSRVTTAVDVYAFGIMMWEVYCGRLAYDGLAPDALKHLVFKVGARPCFPQGTPHELSRLAACCWLSDPAERPTMDEVILELEGLAAVLP